MWCVCFYDPVRDICPTDQFGYVDLGKAFVEGVVPFVDGIVEDSFNKIDNPKSILGSPKNVFDALEFDKSIRAYTPKSEVSEGVSEGE